MSLEIAMKEYKTEKNEIIKFRLIMVIHFLQNKSFREIADWLLVSKDKVRYWTNRYQKEGIEGLKTKSKSGRPSKIRYSELKSSLKKSPVDFGYKEDYWTYDLIYNYITEIQGMSISKQYLYEVLRKLNWQPNLRDEVKSLMKKRKQYLKSFTFPKTTKGHSLSASHLETMKDISLMIDAPIHKIITEGGLKPVLQMVHQDKNVTIVEGKTEAGKLSIKYEFSV